VENSVGSSSTSPSKAPPEVKARVWRAFSRSVADLHYANVLRKDIDDVSRSVYNPDTDAITFGHGSAAEDKVGRPATVNELAHNLVALMLFVFGHKTNGNPVDIWGVFESVYLKSMDERGPQVVESLRETRTQLQEASALNKRALALANISNLDEARVVFEQVIHIRQVNGDCDGYCGALCNLALVCADAGDFEEAHAAVDKASRSAREHARHKTWSLALFQKGFLFKRQSNRADAVKYATLAIHIWSKTGQPIPEQFVASAKSLLGESNEMETVD
jgi:tetratricopeptide (TPR) repeat protein